MGTTGVIAPLNELDDLEPGFLRAQIASYRQIFPFQGSKPGLRHRVIVAISCATDRLANSVLHTAALVGFGGVLATLVRMQDRSTRIPASHRHLQRSKHQRSVLYFRRSPTENPACAGIQDHCQKQGALPGWQPGRVRYPQFVGPFRVKLAIYKVGNAMAPPFHYSILNSVTSFVYNPFHAGWHASIQK